MNNNRFKENVEKIINEGKYSTLRKYQLTLLEMLKEIHKICEDNNIDYWIDGGTLLGAIRHGGFIPWDDDLDICMTRINYEKFINIIQQGLPKGMIYEKKHCKYWVQESLDIRLSFLKLYYIEKFKATEGYLNEPFKGAYIDVFPMDYIDESSCKNRLNRTISKLVTIERRKANKPKHCLKIIIDKFNIEKNWIRRSKKNETLNLKKILVYGIETPFMNQKFIHEYNDIFPLKLVKFEDSEFFAPNNYDKYLTDLYGDYMKIPKEEDRQMHLKDLEI